MAYPNSINLRGYATSWLTNRVSTYKPNNGFVSGNQNYAPGAPSAQFLTLTFTAAPANSSGLSVPDGPGNTSGTPVRNFTFTYSGSPGSGIIPLVAGGGTAAQAATATQVALAAQLTNWTVTNPSAGVVRMVRNQKGFNLSAAQITAFRVGTTNITLGNNAATFAQVIPGRFGKNYCTLPA